MHRPYLINLPLLVLLAGLLTTPCIVHDTAVGDLTGDGRPEHVLLLRRPLAERASWCLITGENPDRKGLPRLLYLRGLKGLNPWKVRLADAVGSGRSQVVFGCWKKTPYNPRFDNRLFFYELDEAHGILRPVFRASRLASPYLDFELIDLDKDGRAEPVAVEVLENGHYIVRAYRWKGFGFGVCYTSREFTNRPQISNRNATLYIGDTPYTYAQDALIPQS